MRASLFAVCLLAAVTLASAGRWVSPSDLGLPAVNDAPDFCHGLECPPFKLLKNTSQYQLREYEGAKFVGTTVEGSNFEAAITKGFTRLFRYISGNNVDNAKISMTAPVITFIKPSEDFKSADKNYTVAFYLPQQFQGDAPKPKDDSVNIVDAPGVTVYVKVFGGFGTGGSVLKEADILRQDLMQDKISFKDGAFAYAAYDGPQKLINRHNEVWLTAADTNNFGMNVMAMQACTVDAIQSALAAAQKAVAQIFHN
ncbi:hypothetical protein ABBQ38_010245 [Trebouxia sp. C0009 RCD-2024]